MHYIRINIIVDFERNDTSFDITFEKGRVRFIQAIVMRLKYDIKTHLNNFVAKATFHSRPNINNVL